MKASQAVAQTGEKGIRIAGASGYWGDAAHATAQILAGSLPDYIVYDYLAEITMAILARAKAKNPDMGYATDFITAAMAPNLKEIARRKIKIISNAGGLNPKACANAVHTLCQKLGIDLTIAVISGDDVSTSLPDSIRDMFTGAPLPPTDRILSANAYLGAHPIARALDAGADIVITGRCVDSALTLGACLHAFGWDAADWDRLAAGSLAGHILECGVQATGGNFTDWQNVEGMDNLGYPIAHILPDGSFEISKPEGTGGCVSVATVAEQMLYEIGDPQNYVLPDVVCDFSEVLIEPCGENRVRVSGAKGYPAPCDYKVCLSWLDGYKGGNYVSFVGAQSGAKAKAFHEAVLSRARKTLRTSGLSDYTETSMEILGPGSQFGKFDPEAREVVLKTAVKHEDIKGVGIFLKTLAGLGLAAPPGISGFTGVRAKPTPVVRLFSGLIPKRDVEIGLTINGHTERLKLPQSAPAHPPLAPHTPPGPSGHISKKIPLSALAYARSGDKGDSVNIGILPRQAEALAFIWATLNEPHLRAVFGHFLTDESEIRRYYLPGLPAMNIVMTQALGGGGVASLRNDPQGKAYAQILLETEIDVPADWPTDLPTDWPVDGKDAAP